MRDWRGIKGGGGFPGLLQGTDAARARTELNWSASHPALTDEFRQGGYRP